MYRIITVEREYGCGGAEIARTLADRLGWKLWDNAITEEIAKLAEVSPSTVARCDERVESTFYRLAKVFWRGSYERSMPLARTFDSEDLVPLTERILKQAAEVGNCVVVGRGAPYFLRERDDAFHVFLYAPRGEKLRRLRTAGIGDREAEELLESVDRDRVYFIKRYFGADWPTRSLYHMMLNTAIGDENVVSVILETMRQLETQAITR